MIIDSYHRDTKAKIRQLKWKKARHINDILSNIAFSVKQCLQNSPTK